MASDKITELYEFIYKIDRRVSTLEKDTAFIETRIVKASSDSKEKYSALHQELDDIRASFESIKNSLKNCRNIMSAISKDLKFTLKKEQIDQLSSRVDSIKFEDFITRKEMLKGLLD